MINVANCPVLWFIKLQTETALSAMEAEINVLAHSCKKLFPIVDLVSELGKVVGLSAEDLAMMHESIHKDNAGTLVLAEMLPPQFTPQSKSIALKTLLVL